MKKSVLKKGHLAVLLAVLLFGLLGCNAIEPINGPEVETTIQETTLTENTIQEDGHYSSAEDVAAYLTLYGHLPNNYITKKEAIAKGWDSDKGNLWDVTDQMIIGGDVFGNREGLLPKAKGRVWYECDVHYAGGFRGAERIVFSNDGLIYYTKDHYKSFEALNE